MMGIRQCADIRRRYDIIIIIIIINMPKAGDGGPALTVVCPKPGNEDRRRHDHHHDDQHGIMTVMIIITRFGVVFSAGAQTASRKEFSRRVEGARKNFRPPVAPPASPSKCRGQLLNSTPPGFPTVGLLRKTCARSDVQDQVCHPSG